MSTGKNNGDINSSSSSYGRNTARNDNSSSEESSSAGTTSTATADIRRFLYADYTPIEGIDGQRNIIEALRAFASTTSKIAKIYSNNQGLSATISEAKTLQTDVSSEISLAKSRAASKIRHFQGRHSSIMTLGLHRDGTDKLLDNSKEELMKSLDVAAADFAGRNQRFRERAFTRIKENDDEAISAIHAWLSEDHLHLPSPILANLAFETEMSSSGQTEGTTVRQYIIRRIARASSFSSPTSDNTTSIAADAAATAATAATRNPANITTTSSVVSSQSTDEYSKKKKGKKVEKTTTTTAITDGDNIGGSSSGNSSTGGVDLAGSQGTVPTSSTSSFSSHSSENAQSSSSVASASIPLQRPQLSYVIAIAGSELEFWNSMRRVSDLGLRDVMIPVGFKEPITEKLRQAFRIERFADSQQHEREIDYKKVDDYYIVHVDLQDQDKTMTLQIASDASEPYSHLFTIKYNNLYGTGDDINNDDEGGRSGGGKGLGNRGSNSSGAAADNDAAMEKEGKEDETGISPSQAPRIATQSNQEQIAQQQQRQEGVGKRILRVDYKKPNDDGTYLEVRDLLQNPEIARSYDLSMLILLGTAVRTRLMNVLNNTMTIRSRGRLELLKVGATDIISSSRSLSSSPSVAGATVSQIAQDMPAATDTRGPHSTDGDSERRSPTAAMNSAGTATTRVDYVALFDFLLHIASEFNYMVKKLRERTVLKDEIIIREELRRSGTRREHSFRLDELRSLLAAPGDSSPPPPSSSLSLPPHGDKILNKILEE